MDLKREITDLLIVSLEELIKIGSKNTFWGTTRANSDAILALTTCLPEYDYYKLKSKCIQKISKDSNELNGLVNWDEEIWDTSISIMALSSDLANNKVKILNALNWIESKYIKHCQSWNEELWETLLALNAIAFSRNKSINSYEKNNYFEGSIKWINHFYNTPQTGVLINWHDTALYLLFIVNSEEINLENNIKLTLESHLKSSCEAILQTDIELYDSVLWTSEVWSNGLVLWALSEAKYGTFEESKMRSIINWFKENINKTDTPIEDRSFAIIGLYKYLEYLEIIEGKDNPIKIKENLQVKISKLINTRVNDFIPKPPFIDKHSHIDYYILNLNKRYLNVLFILLLTFFLTYFSISNSNYKGDFYSWLSIIPILLGILTTIAQLTNFDILPKKSKNKKNEE